MDEESPVIIEPSGPHRASIIWLHGLGADGHDFVPIARELGLPEEAGIRFVFPHAPERPITINGGMRMRGWYDVREHSIDRSIDPEEIRASCDTVRGLIEGEQERGISVDRIVLAGFSQGAAIALQTGLRLPDPLAGILGLSGYLPLPGDLDQLAGSPAARTPVFLAHGEFDGIVQLPLGEHAASTLRQMGVEVMWKAYPMDHAVCAQEIGDVGSWIRDRLQV